MAFCQFLTLLETIFYILSLSASHPILILTSSYPHPILILSSILTSSPQSSSYPILILTSILSQSYPHPIPILTSILSPSYPHIPILSPSYLNKYIIYYLHVNVMIAFNYLIPCRFCTRAKKCIYQAPSPSQGSVRIHIYPTYNHTTFSYNIPTNHRP